VLVGARETAAASTALGAYLTTVLPTVRRELQRWREVAAAIPDPSRRRRALAALEEKRLNVEAVAVFATLAPLRRRRAVLRAIVPLQLAIDYRDTLEEAGEIEGASGEEFLAALDAGWVREAEALPGFRAVAPLLRAAVARCAEGQRRTHAAVADRAQLQRWAEGLDRTGDYRWWEFAAGASSSVATHALIAAAADPSVSAAEAASVDAAYYPSIGALTVLLDDLVDQEADLAAGEHNYLSYYRNPAEAAARIQSLVSAAEVAVRGLPRSRRHLAILDGVLAYYLTAPEADFRYVGEIGENLLAKSSPTAGMLKLLRRLR
jgi:tetraprenyl-beta-curcumene synthase